MFLHPEYLIFNLIDLYINITNENIIDLDNLKDAFNILEAIINKNEDIKTNFDFDLEINNLSEKYPEYISLNDFELEITCDLDELFEELSNDLEISELDDCIMEYIHNINIYNSLNLKIPLKETKPPLK